MNRLPVSLLVITTAFYLSGPSHASEKTSLTPKAQLGKHLFFDTRLSVPEGQSCADCHGAEVGFTGPDGAINSAGAAYEGAVKGRFGNRKPPASSYGGMSPVLHFDKEEKVWVGGMFWDGRATGKRMKDPLAEQAQGPFLNPLEQNIPDAGSVCMKVKGSSYAPVFERVWGKGSLDCARNVAATYDRIARSIAAYERSKEANPFSSKYDDWLRKKVRLSERGNAGPHPFRGEGEMLGMPPEQTRPEREVPALYGFHLRQHRHSEEPEESLLRHAGAVEPGGPGLCGYRPGRLSEGGRIRPSRYAPEMGKFKVPTLRNVDKRPSPGYAKAFGHNGYFESLNEIVHFYNTRDVLGSCEKVSGPRPGANCWPEPEVASNLNRKELGDLGLTEKEEEAIVAFIGTLSDGY